MTTPKGVSLDCYRGAHTVCDWELCECNCHARWEEMMKGNEPHEFKASYTGMVCDAMYEDEKGNGEVCGKSSNHPIHLSRF